MHPAYIVAAVVYLMWTATWYLRQLVRVPLGRDSRQSNRHFASRGVLGQIYFGGVLGVGLLTQMSTPLVYAGALLSLANGPMWGGVYGVGFGLGRSVTPWIGAMKGEFEAPHRVSMFLIEGRSRMRWPGVAVVGLSMACLVAPQGIPIH